MSHEHEVPSLLLSLVSYCFQIAPRTCVRCPRASLRKGVARRKLPVHRRWLEPLLASCLSAGAGLKKSLCATVERWECTLLVHERDSQFAVCPQHCSFAHTLLPDVHIGSLPTALK